MISQNRCFLLSLEVPPPPLVTAKYSFFNTAIFCSGNCTGEIFFQLDFFPYSAQNAFPLSAVPFPCILSDRPPRDRLYTMSGVLQLLGLADLHVLPSDTAHTERCSEYPHGYVQQEMPSRYQSQEWKHTDISTKENLPISPITVFPAKGAVLKTKLLGCSVSPLQADWLETFFHSSV